MSRVLNLQKLTDPTHKFLLGDGDGDSTCSYFLCGACSGYSMQNCTPAG